MYKLFLDESGDHNLKVIDPNHPVFALVGCIFEENYYNKEAIKKVKELKIKYFNSTEVILHSRDIRKQENKPFLVLRNKEARDEADDELLYIAYSKIMLQGTSFMKSDEFQKRIKDLVFIPKKENEIGTQLADLAAYPIATHILPNRDKRAFNVLKPKFRKSKEGEIMGYGLKIFP